MNSCWWRGARIGSRRSPTRSLLRPAAADGAGHGSRTTRRRVRPRRGADVARPRAGIVVNNAGFGLLGSPIAQSRRATRDDRSKCARADRAIARFRRQPRASSRRHSQRGFGRRFMPGPGMAVYYASKAYVLSFSEALHHELSQRGIRVTALCPGPVPTEFQTRAGLRGDRGRSRAVVAFCRAGGADRLSRVYARQARGRGRYRQPNRRISWCEWCRTRALLPLLDWGTRCAARECRAATRVRVLNLPLNAIRRGGGRALDSH